MDVFSGTMWNGTVNENKLHNKRSMKIPKLNLEEINKVCSSRFSFNSMLFVSCGIQQINRMVQHFKIYLKKMVSNVYK